MAKALRADAFASVSRIVEAARRVFVGDDDGPRTLTRVAQEAGVGIATLYRHFPNRSSLATAVYDDVFASELRPLLAQLAHSEAPREILLDMSERLLDVLGGHGGLAESLENAADATRALLRRHADDIETAVHRAQESGTLRADLDASDVFALLALVATGSGALGAGVSRRRLLSLLLDGLGPDRPHSLPPHEGSSR